ncbi:MAG TPA: hypothetical protein VHL10_10170, partial [Nitrososphaera sp.]|nr:hypothetical protein [Nitrososphaera sp.]
NYLLSVSQVGLLAKELVQAQATISGVNASYLRVLTAGVQHDLVGNVRLRAARNALDKPDADQIDKQLKSVEKIHDLYYAAIVAEVIDDTIKDNPRLQKEERNRRSLERNRRTNFARSAKSTLVSYIKAGFDVTALVIPTLTKRSIYEAVQATRPSDSESTKASVLRKFDAAVDSVQAAAKALCERDAEAAREKLQALLSTITALLVGTGVQPVNKASVAVANRVPFREGRNIFWPTDHTVQ